MASERETTISSVMPADNEQVGVPENNAAKSFSVRSTGTYNNSALVSSFNRATGEDLLERISRTERRTERWALAVVLSLIAAICSAVYFTDGAIVTSAMGIFRKMENPDKFGPRDKGLSCKDPRNANTVFCKERSAQVESDWRSVVRFQGGHSNSFTLGGRKK